MNNAATYPMDIESLLMEGVHGRNSHDDIADLPKFHNERILAKACVCFQIQSDSLPNREKPLCN